MIIYILHHAQTSHLHSVIFIISLLIENCCYFSTFISLNLLYFIILYDCLSPHHLILIPWLLFHLLCPAFLCSEIPVILLQLHLPPHYPLSSILSQASILDCLRALLSCPHFVTLALCLPSTPGPTQTASIWIWCWRASLIACKLTSVCISTDSFSNPVQPLKVPVRDVYGRCLGDVVIDVFSFGVLP